MSSLSPGDVVRPVISAAGLDARRQYVVHHVEGPTPWLSIAYLRDEAGRLLPPVANAHVFLERVGPPMPRRPRAALRH